MRNGAELNGAGHPSPTYGVSQYSTKGYQRASRIVYSYSSSDLNIFCYAGIYYTSLSGVLQKLQSKPLSTTGTTLLMIVL